jgi:hypothetical protein
MVIQAVHLDRPFSPSVLRPWKYRQTEVDGRSIDSIERIFEPKLVLSPDNS